MAHTPGPWKVAGQGESGTQQLPIRANGKIIAAIRDHGSLDDASLVAAAPQLLAACKAAMPWLAKAVADGVFDGCVCKNGGVRVLNMLDDAIAKAEGSQ